MSLREENMQIDQEPDREAPTVRPGSLRTESGTRRRALAKPTVEDLNRAYDAAEATGGLASALEMATRLASGPVHPAVLAKLPPLSAVRDLARVKELELYRLAHGLESALGLA